MSKTQDAAQNAQVLLSVTPDQVANAIKSAGCAVTTTEQDGITQLHSASHGIGFQVLWGNVNQEKQYLDFTLSCPLRVQGGALPDTLLSEWHRTKRFARVAKHGDFVVLEMDVVVAGGVTTTALDVSLQLWTQMMGQFFLYLRNFKPEVPAEGSVPAVEKTEEAAA